MPRARVSRDHARITTHRKLQRCFGEEGSAARSVLVSSDMSPASASSPPSSAQELLRLRPQRQLREPGLTTGLIARGFITRRLNANDIFLLCNLRAHRRTPNCTTQWPVRSSLLKRRRCVSRRQEHLQAVCTLRRVTAGRYRGSSALCAQETLSASAFHCARAISERHT